MVGNLSPPFFEGVFGAKVFVRGVADWDINAGGNHSESDIPIVTNREAGDILFVYVGGPEQVSYPPVNGGWLLLNATTGLVTQLWSRLATGDGDDAYTIGDYTDHGQGGHSAQMVAMAGLDWAARAYPHKSTDYVARNQDIVHPSVADGTEDDTLLIAGAMKTWGPGGDPYPGITASFDEDEGFEAFSGQGAAGWEDRDAYMIWGWRYDEGSAVTVLQTSMNQVPLDDDNPNAGSVFSMTVRCIEDPT